MLQSSELVRMRADSLGADMRWGPFIILALLTLVCQTTVVQAMAIGSIWPNWMLVLALFYALWAPWPDAAIACWMLGLTIDLYTLGSAGRIGLYALCFAVVCWLVVRIRQALLREHAVTQVLVAFGATMLIELLAHAYRVWRMPDGAPAVPVWGPAFFTACYTAAWTPYLHWPLRKLGRFTGLGTLRRT